MTSKYSTSRYGCDFLSRVSFARESPFGPQSPKIHLVSAHSDREGVDIVLKGLSTAFLLPSPVWLYKKHGLSFITLLPIHTLLSTTHASSELQFITFITGHLALSIQRYTKNMKDW